MISRETCWFDLLTIDDESEKKLSEKKKPFLIGLEREKKYKEILEALEIPKNKSKKKEASLTTRRSPRV